MDRRLLNESLDILQEWGILPERELDDAPVKEGKIANVLLTLSLLGGNSGIALAGFDQMKDQLKSKGIELVGKYKDGDVRKAKFKVVAGKAKHAIQHLKDIANKAGVKTVKTEVAAGHPRIVSSPGSGNGGGHYRI